MVKMSSGLLSLKWNHHRSTFLHVLANIRQKESYSDVTLACAGKFYPTHKLVLSTCSEYFEEMFERTQCKHPVIVLKDIGADDLEALLSYMYDGEVNVLQENLSSLIKAAECLKIKGLAVADNDPNERTKEKKLHSSSSNSGSNISSNNNRDVQRNDRRPVNSNGSGIKRSNVNSGSGEDGAQLAKRRRPEARSQLSTSTPPEEGEVPAPAEDIPSEAAGAADSGAEGGSSDKADSDVPPDGQGAAELPEDSQSFIQGLNAEAGVKAEPVEVLDELGFDDRDDAEDSGAGVGPASADLPDFTEEKFSGGEGEDPALWSGGDAPDLFSQPSTSNFGEDESNNDHGGGGKSGNTSSSVSPPPLPLARALSWSAHDPSPGLLSSPPSFSSPPFTLSQEGSGGGGDSSNTVAALLRLRELTAACSASAAQRSLSHEIFLKQLSQDARPLPESRETSGVPTAQVPANESFGRSGSRLQCPYCSYSTTYLHSLRRHVRSHTGEKPYHCDQCDKSFNKSDSLVVHRRVHTGEKPYSCDRCLYRCRQKSNLVTHQLKHLGLKYACTICDYRSYQKGHVKVHMWNRHKVIYEGGQLVGPENVVTS